jgi:hypothetical protein
LYVVPCIKKRFSNAVPALPLFIESLLTVVKAKLGLLVLSKAVSSSRLAVFLNDESDVHLDAVKNLNQLYHQSRVSEVSLACSKLSVSQVCR